jgi:S1-C subfamily serine protease
MEMIRRSGQQGVPVITTDDDVIVGFDQVRLAKIADRFAGPKRPPLGLLAANTESYIARHPEAASAVPPGTKGVYVGEVRPDSVAERAGLRPGDILIGLAGKRIRDMSMLDQMVDTLKAGDRAEIRYIRNGIDETTTLQF